MLTKIVVADDQKAVRRAVRSLLNSRRDWKVCAEAANGQEALVMAKQLNPDVVILDINMPVMSGLQATKEIVKLNLNTRVLVLTMCKDLQEEARHAGAHGYVLKSKAAGDLIPAIETLLGGGTFFEGSSASSYRLQRFANAPPSR